jgi:prophage regulatory protein
MTEQVQRALAILRLRQAKERFGLGRTSIYDRLNPKSPRYDPSFPKPITLGVSARARGFLEHEVEEWLRQQVEASRKAEGSQ